MKKKLLIVVDYQKDFVDGSLGNPAAAAIEENIVKKIEEYRALGEGGQVIFTYDTHSENYMQTQEGSNLSVPHCIKGTEGWELYGRVAEMKKEGDVVFEKPTFGSTELPEYIKANYNTSELEIELIGLCTDICVVSNALMLKANFPEKEIYVVSDCSAGVTPATHNAALETMKMCQINII